MKTLLGLLLLGLVPVCGAFAQPNAPLLSGRIVDHADLLSPATEQYLDALLAAHEDSTTNQIAVLTIPSLGGEPIEFFSVRVAQAWALGRADRDNGVLILIARDDRALRIEVGHGLEGVLTDLYAGCIIDYVMVPRFREGDFDAGVRQGVEAVVGVLSGSYLPPEHAYEDWSRQGLTALAVACCLFIGLILFLAARAVVPITVVILFFTGTFVHAVGTGVADTFWPGITWLGPALVGAALLVYLLLRRYFRTKQKAADAAYRAKHGLGPAPPPWPWQHPEGFSGWRKAWEAEYRNNPRYQSTGSSSWSGSRSGSSSRSSRSSFSGRGGSFGGGGASGRW